MELRVQVTRFNLALLVAGISVAVGLSYRLAGFAPAGFQAFYWSIPTLLLFFVAAACLFFRDGTAAGQAARPRVALSALVVSVTLDLYQTYTSKHALLMIACLLVLTGAALLWSGRRRAQDLVILFAAVWSALICLQGDYAVIGGDLLPIVVQAGRNLLHGIDPYAADYSHVTSNPFFYLPLQWLPFIPAAAFTIDPRLINVAILLGAVLMLRIGMKKDEAGGLSVLCLAVAFSASFVRAAARTYMLPYWLLLIVFVWALIAQRDILAAILLGCLLATRQTFIFDAVALFAGLVRQIDGGRLLRLGAVAGVAAALCLLPFVIWHPGLFTETFLQGPRLAVAGNLHNAIATRQVGLVPLLRAAGFALPGFAVQAFFVLSGLIVIFLRKPATRTEVALSAGAVDLLAALSGPQTFEYYWGSAFVIIMSGLFMSNTLPKAELARDP